MEKQRICEECRSPSNSHGSVIENLLRVSKPEDTQSPCPAIFSFGPQKVEREIENILNSEEW